MAAPSGAVAGGLNKIYHDPYRNVALSIIFWAVREAEEPILNLKTPHHIRIMGAQKREALGFLFSKDVEVWINLANLPINIKALREKLKLQVDGMPAVEEFIRLNEAKAVGRKKSLMIAEIEGGDLVK